MHKTVELDIDDLKLDPINPRIEEQDSQLETLQSVIDDQGSKLGELTEDIALNGLSPMDRFLVIKDKDGKYIALEGNRRTAALKILQNPEILKDLEIPDALRGKLVKAASKADASKLEPIDSAEVKSRTEAHRWIKLRHTGENSGRGIVNWNAVQSARFSDSKMKPVIDFINMAGGDQPIVGPKFPITSLERLLENPDVRKTLGIEISDGRFQSKVPAAEIAKPLLKMAKDLADKTIKVDDIKTKAQQKNYIEGFAKNELPKTGTTSKPTKFSELTKKLPAKAKSSSTTKSPTLKKKRSKLIPSTFKAPISHPKLSSLASDLTKLSVQSYPIPVAVCLRVFVEGTIDVYMDTFNLLQHNAGGKGPTLSQKIEIVNTDFKTRYPAQKKLANAAKAKLCLPDSVISTTRLHEFVHNTEFFPSVNDLLTAWDSIEKWMAQLWHAIEDSK